MGKSSYCSQKRPVPCFRDQKTFNLMKYSRGMMMVLKFLSIKLKFDDKKRWNVNLTPKNIFLVLVDHFRYERID